MPFLNGLFATVTILGLSKINDVRHTVNLSLVYNSANSNENAFNIANGFKLNLQKQIKFTGFTPTEFVDENGKSVTILNNGGVYTFDDESQRIMRVREITVIPFDPNPKDDLFPAPMTDYIYTVEYPDFSKEEYSSSGKLIEVYDKYGSKYLCYSYIGSNLNRIAYGNKYLYLTHSGNNLTAITYKVGINEICKIDFDFTNNNPTVDHYSGVDYVINRSAGYSVEVKDDTVIKDSFEITCNPDNTEISITDHRDKVNTYRFYQYENDDGSAFANVDHTNSKGVITRTQYKGKNALCSYEMHGEEPAFEGNGPEDKFSGAVQVYKSQGDLIDEGTSINLSSSQGFSMRADNNGANSQTWIADNVGEAGKNAHYIVSGWIKLPENSATTNLTIQVGDNNANEDFILDSLCKGMWTFFTLKFVSQAQNIRILFDENIDAKDFRLCMRVAAGSNPLYVATEYEKSLSYTVDNKTHANAIKNLTFKNCGDIDSGDRVYASDILRFKFNQIKGVNTNEFYCNNGRKVLIVLNPDEITFSEGNDNGAPEYYLKDAEFIKLNYTASGVTSTILHETSNIGEGRFEIVTCADNEAVETRVFDSNLDVIMSIKDNIMTHYTRNEQGLVTEEAVLGLYVYYISYSDNLIVVESKDPEDWSIIISTTKYYIDTTWGGVYKVEVLDENDVVQSTITDSFDGDMCALESRTFGSADGISNELTYSDDKVETLKCGNLKYKMSYTNGHLTGVSKLNPAVNTTPPTYNPVETHSYAENNDSTTTVTSAYPFPSTAVYTETRVFDQYDRLIEIENVLENTYAVKPTFAEEDITNEDGSVTPAGTLIENTDIGDSLLAISTDKLMSETTRYMYNEKGLPQKIIVSDSNNYSNKKRADIFEYDNLGRLTESGYVWGNKGVECEIEYTKEATDPSADGKAKKYTYSICNLEYNGFNDPFLTPYETTNTYDDFNRISAKAHVIGDETFTKSFEYDKTRVAKLTDSHGGAIQYEYDVLGRISKEKDGSGNVLKAYTYDSFGQLTDETNNILDKTFQYVYNGIGNITSVKVNGATTQFGYSSAHLDRLTSYGGQAITYDAIGCPVRYGNKLLTWNKGKLVKICDDVDENSSESSESVEFTYNAYGQRVSKVYEYNPGPDYSGDFLIGSTTTYDYDFSGRLIHEACEQDFTESASVTDEFIYLYDESGIIGCAYYVNGSLNGKYYYQRNLLGDVVGIYNTSGTKVVGYAYDAFGNCTTTLGANNEFSKINHFRYRGYYLDRETGLYYLNARYYNPEWRRFISPANVSSLNPKAVNGLNLYAYANNNPITIVPGKPNTKIARNQTNLLASQNVDIAGMTLSVIGSLYSSSYVWENIGTQIDILSAMADGTLRLFDSNGLGYTGLDPYSKALAKFGKGMVVAGSIFSWTSSVYNNFNNPYYSSNEILAATIADAGYYTLKGLGTYYAGQGIAFAASSAGILAGGYAIWYLGVSYGVAVALSGGVALLVAGIGAGLLLLIGDLFDNGWYELKKEWFE